MRVAALSEPDEIQRFDIDFDAREITSWRISWSTSRPLWHLRPDAASLHHVDIDVCCLASGDENRVRAPIHRNAALEMRAGLRTRFLHSRPPRAVCILMASV